LHLGDAQWPARPGAIPSPKSVYLESKI
jgi:hypothetical protein